MGSRTLWSRLPWQHRIFSRVAIWLITVGALTASAYPQAPQTNTVDKDLKPTFVTRSDDDLLLLSVHLDGVSLSQDVNAYQVPGGILLPLGEICRLLELAVTTSPESRSASGYVRHQDRLFHLNVPTHRARLGNIELTFSATEVEVQKTDLYIDAVLLSKWFGLGFVIDLHGADIQVKPLEPLPVQQRLERMRQATVASSLYSTYRDPNFPRIANPYLMSGGPAIDQTLSFSIGPSGTGAYGRYTALVAADVQREGLTAFLQLDSHANSASSTLSIGQMDPEGRLLGELRAREYDIGQFYVPAYPLVWDTHVQSGLVVSNYPLDRSSQFDVTSFTGILLPGWDVQLFRGESLIDYQAPNTTGRYEFKHVPLSFGTNPYLLVFNGPGGERRLESKTSNISTDLVKPGERWYRIAVDPTPKSLSPVIATTNFGLTQNVSTSLGVATSTIADGTHQYISAGLQAFSGGVRGFANLVADSRSGTAQEFGAQWLWNRTTVSVTQRFVENMESPVLLEDLSSIKTKTTVQIGNLSLPKWSGLRSTDLNLSQERSSDGIQRWDIRDRISVQLQNVGVTHWFEWQAQSGETSLFRGQLLVNRWSQGPQIQGELTYSWSNTLRIDQAVLSVRKIFANQHVLSCGVYENPTSQNLGISAELTRNVGTYTYGYTADLSTKGGMILGLSVSYGTVRKPINGRWEHTALSEATMGSVQTRVFLDANRNGAYDPGEKLLAGVRVLANNFPVREVTAIDGLALVSGLTPFVPIDLQIAESTLASPLWVSKRAGVRIVPRPGSVPVIDFPILCTGEVTGTVFEKGGTMNEARGGVTLELVDPTNHVMGKQVSAYDGFFTFSRVPVGEYHIRTAIASSFRVVGSSPGISIPPDGAYLDGVRIVVELRGARPTTIGQ